MTATDKLKISHNINSNNNTIPIYNAKIKNNKNIKKYVACLEKDYIFAMF